MEHNTINIFLVYIFLDYRMNIRRVSHRGVSNVYRSYIDFIVCVSKRPYASPRSELKISKDTGEQHEYVLT